MLNEEIPVMVSELQRISINHGINDSNFSPCEYCTFCSNYVCINYKKEICILGFSLKGALCIIAIPFIKNYSTKEKMN